MESVTPASLRDVIWTFFAANRDMVLDNVTIGPGTNQEEAVHVLRVATKKIRTVYRLCEAINPSGFRPKKVISELRILFRSAGFLRELQVHQSVVDQYELLHVAFYQKMSKRLLAERRLAAPGYESARKSFPEASFDNPTKQVRKLVESVPEEEWAAVTTAFTMARLAAVHAVMPIGYEPELIHKARIYLKEAMYLIGLLHAAGYREDFSADWLTAAKMAAEVAGEWHDREVFAHWLHTQIRPTGALAGREKQYLLLQQDLNVHTKALVKRFRELIEPLRLPMASISETRK